MISRRATKPNRKAASEDQDDHNNSTNHDTTVDGSANNKSVDSSQGASNNSNGRALDKYKKKRMRGLFVSLWLFVRNSLSIKRVLLTACLLVLGIIATNTLQGSRSGTRRSAIVIVTSPQIYPRILGYYPSDRQPRPPSKDARPVQRIGYQRRVPHPTPASPSALLTPLNTPNFQNAALLAWNALYYQHTPTFTTYNTTFLQSSYYTHTHPRPTHRSVSYDSFDEWTHSMADPMYEGNCVPMHDWQMTTFLTCNAVHEWDIGGEVQGEKAKLVSNGHWRDVWVMQEEEGLGGRRFAMKNQRYEHDYEERNYDRHRRDAVSMERLSFSKFVVHQYQYCQNAGFSEFSNGGDLDIVSTDVFPTHAKWFTIREKVLIAYQVAQSMADLHSVGAIPLVGTDTKKKKKIKGDEGVVHRTEAAAIAHTDISPNQFIKVDGIYKMNDFNRARFLRRNKKTGEPCTFTVGSNKGSFRAPEEYRYDGENEMVDVYSMGNIIYTLIAEHDVFPDLSSKAAKKFVINGGRPKIPPPVWKQAKEKKDLGVMALINAMHMCHHQDPNDRFTAKEVAEHLRDTLVNYFKIEKPEEEVVPDKGEEKVKREYYG